MTSIPAQHRIATTTPLVANGLTKRAFVPEKYLRSRALHLVAGQRVPAIAAELHISQHTVRNHLKSIHRKLGVGNQSELIERVRNLDDPKS